MFEYSTAINTLVFSLFISFGFAIYHKMWRYCLSGFMFLSLVGFILTLHLFSLVDYEIWIFAHFYIISVGCLSTIAWTIIYKYRNYKKRCKGD